MTTFSLTINVNNAAFDDPNEFMRVLRKVGQQAAYRNKADFGTVRDINGNTVGHWKVEDID